MEEDKQVAASLVGTVAKRRPMHPCIPEVAVRRIETEAAFGLFGYLMYFNVI